MGKMYLTQNACGIVALLLTLLLISSAAYAETNSSEASAIQLATDDFMGTLGVDASGVTGFDMSVTNEVEHWVVTFKNKLDKSVTMTYRISKTYGDISDIQASNGFYDKIDALMENDLSEIISSWEAERGAPIIFWSYVDKANFVEEYGNVRSAFGVALPGYSNDNDLPITRALQIAKEQMLSVGQWTEEDVEGYLLDITFYPDYPTSIDASARIWVIRFRGTEKDHPTIYEVYILSPDGAIVMEGSEAIDAQNESSIGENALEIAQDVLYYNEIGGMYYHSSADKCPVVDPFYFPLTRFSRADLDIAPYSELSPCQRCIPQR